MVDIEFHPITKEDIKELYDYFSRYSLEYADSFVEGLYDHLSRDQVTACLIYAGHIVDKYHGKMEISNEI